MTVLIFIQLSAGYSNFLYRLLLSHSRSLAEKVMRSVIQNIFSYKAILFNTLIYLFTSEVYNAMTRKENPDKKAISWDIFDWEILFLSGSNVTVMDELFSKL